MPQVKCKICNVKFYIKPSHLKLGYGKYCSRKCQCKGQLKGKFVYCYICKKKIWRTPKALKHSKSGNYFCNKSCQTLWRNTYYSGSKHPNWRDGENQNYRNILLKHKIKVICQICRVKDKRLLIAHHKDRNRKNNTVNNLTWLCFNCHHLIHHHDQKLN